MYIRSAGRGGGLPGASVAELPVTRIEYYVFHVGNY